MSADVEAPSRSRAGWGPKYWACIYLLRRLAFLALMVWAGVTCALSVTGPHPEAAAAGVACALVGLVAAGVAALGGGGTALYFARKRKAADGDE